MKPQPGERWRATFEGIVRDANDEYFDVRADGPREVYEEFWPNQVGWVYEKIADAVQPEPGPGSIILDAKNVIWHRNLDPDAAFPWTCAMRDYGRGSGYSWAGQPPAYPSSIHKPVRVLLDPSKEDE